jgi:hypothetical protein
MNLYHQERIKHRKRIIEIFKNNSERRSIVLEAIRTLGESLDAVAPIENIEF